MKRLFTYILLTFTLIVNGQDETQFRKDFVEILENTLHIREATGNNDGKDVEEILRSVGLGKGYPWCAAYTTWALDMCDVPNPKSAWSPDWAREKYTIWSQKLVKQRKQQEPQSGDVFTIYYPNLKRVGHVGFFIKKAKNGYFITIEGNTNDGGSRLGIGVFKRKRDPRKIYAINDYITPYITK